MNITTALEDLNRTTVVEDRSGGDRHWGGGGDSEQMGNENGEICSRRPTSERSQW